MHAIVALCPSRMHARTVVELNRTDGDSDCIAPMATGVFPTVRNCWSQVEGKDCHYGAPPPQTTNYKNVANGAREVWI